MWAYDGWTRGIWVYVLQNNECTQALVQVRYVRERWETMYFTSHAIIHLTMRRSPRLRCCIYGSTLRHTALSGAASLSTMNTCALGVAPHSLSLTEARVAPSRIPRPK